MRIIPFVNHKGGVGKTTCTINFGSILAALNYRVLLIDLDAQGNLETGIKFEGCCGKSIYDVLTKKDDIRQAIYKTPLPKIDIVPSSIDLAGLEYEEGLCPWQLKKAISVLDYDYVLIDVPPALGSLMVSSILAATDIIIPLQCEFFALNGLVNLLDIIHKIEKNYHINVNILGVLVLMYEQRSKISKSLLEKVQSGVPLPQFKTVLPRSSKIVESNSAGLPIILYDLNSAVARAYMEATKEMLSMFYKAA